MNIMEKCDRPSYPYIGQGLVKEENSSANDVAMCRLWLDEQRNSGSSVYAKRVNSIDIGKKDRW